MAKGKSYQVGTVKWFREDGTGYIIPDSDPSRVIIVHYSAIRQTTKNLDRKNLTSGQRVKFTTQKIIGTEMVTDVWST